MTTPPLFQTYSRQTVATGKTFGSNQMVGAAIGGGALIASDPFSNSQVVLWPSVWDLADFKVVNYPDATPRANSACYDPINQCFYTGVFITLPSSKAVTVYKITLDGTLTRLANATLLGSNPSSSVALSQICTDSTYIYMVLGAGAGQSSNVIKLSCLDGSLVAGPVSIGLTPTTVPSSAGRQISMLDASTLLIAGSSTSPWVATIPTSLAAPTVADVVAYSNNPGNQVVVVGGNAFQSVNGSTLAKTTPALAMSAFTLPNAATGSAVCYDGSTIWCGSSGFVYGFDTSGSIVGWRPDVILPGAIEFLGAIPGALVAVDGSGNAGLFPNPSAPSIPPILGRGAC